MTHKWFIFHFYFSLFLFLLTSFFKVYFGDVFFICHFKLGFQKSLILRSEPSGVRCHVWITKKNKIKINTLKMPTLFVFLHNGLRKKFTQGKTLRNRNHFLAAVKHGSKI